MKPKMTEMTSGHQADSKPTAPAQRTDRAEETNSSTNLPSRRDEQVPRAQWRLNSVSCKASVLVLFCCVVHQIKSRGGHRGFGTFFERYKIGDRANMPGPQKIYTKKKRYLVCTYKRKKYKIISKYLSAQPAQRLTTWCSSEYVAGVYSYQHYY